MNPKKSPPPAGEDGEVSALIATLHRTEQRLEELTAGEVDTVADRDGRMFLLRRAQEQLRHSEAAKHAAIMESLRASESRFRQMADNISDVFFLRDADSGRMLYVSPAYEEIWGRTCESLYAAPASWGEAVHPEDRPAAREMLEKGILAGKYQFHYRIVRPDGSIRWIETKGFPVRDDAGKVVRIAGIAADITQRKQAEGRVAQLNRVHAMLSAINSLIVHVRDRDELFREACRIAVGAGGFKMAWIAVVDHAAMHLKPVAWDGAAQDHLEQMPLSLQEADQALVVLPLLVSGTAVGVLALYANEAGFFDDSEMKLLGELAGDIAFAVDHIDKQERLDYLAYYDELTGLANRRLFLERTSQYVRSATSDGHQLALFLIDLQRFKNINDSLGRDAGDALLKQVAEWLAHKFADANLLGRIGADQFAVVLPELRQDGSVARLLDNAMDDFEQHPFHLGGGVFRIAAKSGVALFPQDGASADALFRNAEAALKKAKASGDRYLFYAPQMTDAVAGKLTLENRLREAFDKGEFVLHYQPKVNLASGKLTGAEALIRWLDPRTGLVPPGRFIPILEETGMIGEVGRWALRKAAADYLRWLGAGLPAVRIAVNVSPLQLRHRDFAAEVARAVAGDPRTPAGLELEITENLIMEDVKHSIATLRAIRDLGVTIAIDDFGTGFSSLSYLSKLPVDTLKIDRSFVVEMTAPEARSLVPAIIGLAHSLKLKVVAEGVETEEQSRLLRLLGCDEMQGYLFGEPVPSEIFEARYLRAMQATA